MLLPQAAPEDLPDLNDRVRRAWWYSADHSPEWDAALLSMHPSGYVREDAVRRLAQVSDGSEVPFLLLRVNDWVAPVRDAARTALLARARAEYAAHFADNMTLVHRLRFARRADHTELLAALTAVLTSVPDALVHALRHGSRETRRLAFGVAPELLFDEALHSGDAVLRLWATPFVRSAAVMERLTCDRSPAVRREALRALPEHAPAMLLDRSASVREAARVLLRGTDFAAIYRDALGSNPVVAIAGLAETGSPADAGLVLPFLTHERVRIRRQAVKTLARFGRVDAIFALLTDPSPAVSAAARDGLRPHARTLDATQLWTIHTTSPLLHIQRNALELIAGLPKWQSITMLIRAASHPDFDIAAAARERVTQWRRHYNRAHSTPTRAELAELNALLASKPVELALDEWTLRELRFTLKAFA